MDTSRSVAHAAPGRPTGLADPGRRRLALRLAALGAVAAWPVAGTARAEPARWREARALMGTRVGIAAQGADPATLQAAAEAAFDRMGALVAVMSHYAGTSRVAAVNLAAGLQAVPVPRELLNVLAMARGVSRASDGAFDITIGSVGRWHFDASDPRMPAPGFISTHLPDVDYRNLVLDEKAGTAYLARRGMRIDPGGIAKLYILEAGLAVLRERGIETALVDGGGDVVATTAPQARPWRVGVRDPRRPERLIGTLDVRRGFVASSGDYERCFVRDGRRYHHVLDPRTGYPAEGPHGVTLLGDSLESVNGLGAATMVLPAGAGQRLIGRHGVEALVAYRDDRVWMTAGMTRRLQPLAA